MAPPEHTASGLLPARGLTPFEKFVRRLPPDGQAACKTKKTWYEPVEPLPGWWPRQSSNGWAMEQRAAGYLVRRGVPGLAIYRFRKGAAGPEVAKVWRYDEIGADAAASSWFDGRTQAWIDYCFICRDNGTDPLDLFEVEVGRTHTRVHFWMSVGDRGGALYRGAAEHCVAPTLFPKRLPAWIADGLSLRLDLKCRRDENDGPYISDYAHPDQMLEDGEDCRWVTEDDMIRGSVLLPLVRSERQRQARERVVVRSGADSMLDRFERESRKEQDT